MEGKLVRDKIPDIITDNGDVASTRILSKEEYLVALDEKLQEEVQEYLEANDLSELGDILEIIRAIASARGSSIVEIDAYREAKLLERGGFEKRIFLNQK